MGVKYRIDYKNYFDESCRVDISHPDYDDDAILIRGIADNACTIDWDCSDDPYDPIINSKATINMWQTEDLPIDINELRDSSDREFTVDFYIDSVIKWKGFIIPDGIQRSFQSAPYEFNITATDGLMLLDGIDYSHDNLEGGRCIINYFRRILFSPSNLGLSLPIYWVNELVNDQFPLEEDVLSGSVRWSARGEGFTDYNGNYKSCMYILEGMLRSMQMRLKQTDGKWIIWRVNDVVSGEITYKYTPATLSGFEINETTIINEIKFLAGNGEGDYSLIEEDAILRSIPALKTVTTTYKEDKRTNILPNGNMDIVVSTANAPLYWQATGATIESIPSLSEAKGSAVQVTNAASGSGYLRAGQAPKSILVPPGIRYEISFYFKGVAQTGDKIVLTDRNQNGEDQGSYSYTVPLEFNGNTEGALNNFASVFPSKPRAAAVDYNADTQEWRFNYIGFTGDIAGSQTITTASQSNFTHIGFLPIDTDILYSTINLGFKFAIMNGYALNENGIIDWGNTPNQIRVTYRRGATIFYLNENGFWVDTITDIQISVGQLKPGDIAQVDFNSKQDIKMPLPDVTPIERTNFPEIKIEFLIPSGRRILLDDVYFSVQDNSDVYKAEYVSSKNTGKEDYELTISSAHSGFYVSNYMTEYTQSGVEKFFSDSKLENATLTEMNSHAIIRNRYKASEVFEGSIYGRGYKYNEIYKIKTLGDKKFLPLKSSWNTEKCTINLTAVEIRNDGSAMDVTHYGSNDNTELSN